MGRAMALYIVAHSWNEKALEATPPIIGKHQTYEVELHPVEDSAGQIKKSKDPIKMGRY